MSISKSFSVFVASILVMPYLVVPTVFSASTNGFSVSVTDGRSTINAGGTLIYAITVSNQSDDQETTTVELRLPDYTTLVSPSNGGELRSGNVVWQNITLSSNSSLTLNVQVTLVPSVENGTVLTAVAVADGVTSTDKTTVGTTVIPQNDIRVTITDNLKTVTPTQELTYSATVKNTGDEDEVVDVHLSLGQFVTILDTDNDAYVNNRSITWYGIELEPGASETFTVDARIDRSASEFFLITTKLQAGGYTATDLTSVQTNADDLMNNDDDDNGSAKIRFTVTPDAAEVLPGGRIRYNVSVRNAGSETVDDLTATVKFDPSVAILVNAGTAQKINASTLEWDIPELSAGETWKTSFELALVDGLPLGTVIPVISTLKGPSIESITLSSRVAVTSVALIGTLPATGFPMDTVATFLLMPFSAAAALFQRRLRLA